MMRENNVFPHPGLVSYYFYYDVFLLLLSGCISIYHANRQTLARTKAYNLVVQSATIVLTVLLLNNSASVTTNND